MDTFFVCPKCGNDKEFHIFTSSFQAIRQSPELGRRVNESDVLPICDTTIRILNVSVVFKELSTTALHLRVKDTSK